MMQFSRGWLFFWTVLLIGGFILPSLIEPIVLVAFGLRALKGPKETVEAFFVLTLYLLGSQNFTSGDAKTLRYLIYFLGFASVFVRKASTHTPLRKFLWAFLILESLIFAVFGQMPALSILKLISFFLGVYTIVEAFAQTRHLRPYWFRFVNTFFLFVLVASAMFLLAGLGFERNGRGFQGIFIHPQTFGPLMAVVTAWFGGIWLVAKRSSILAPTLLGVSLIFIYLSQARTGLAALLLGGGLAYLIATLSSLQIPNKQRFYQLAGVSTVALILLALLNPSGVEEVVLSFIQKRETSSTEVAGLFQESRGFLVDASLLNFAEHPLFGIGLGVPTNYEEVDISDYQSIAGIPISASVEKGFLPAAIVEEMGVLGTLFTIVLLLMIIGRISRRFSFMTLWLVLSALLINIGEAVLFSVGGLGIFVWIIVGLTYSNDLFQLTQLRRKRPRPVSAESMPAPSA